MSGAERGGLPAFNSWPEERAREALLACCRAERWAARVTRERPYATVAALRARAAEVLTDEDVTEALAGHPRIGQAPAATHSSWSRSEQSGVAGASEAVRTGLVAGNQIYETRFGHIYLVCAAGRSATELLGILQARLANDPQTERQVMRDELIKINDLRLAQLIGTETT
ncbi:MAG TPA: 2-oxo-4-hydroxy-4-carboxy-5-ureidoimidazoline decarboxylase [Streptosporangiaceae bacterium]